MFKSKSIFKLVTQFISCQLIGLTIGCSSALFLFLLEYCTELRVNNSFLIYFLPFAGLLIGLIYYYFGKEVSKGNNLLLEEFQKPTKKKLIIMAPLILFGTLITHLFGGSAGREGTAVQLGGAISSQFFFLKRLGLNDKKLLLAIGISAGFAGVFGTPFAATIFSLEILCFSKKELKYVFPCLLTSLTSYYCCMYWPITHSHYEALTLPSFNFTNYLWVALIGVLCGLLAFIFTNILHFFSTIYKLFNVFPPIKTMIGGLILSVTIILFDLHKFSGLGIPTIQESFFHILPSSDFIIKLLLTTFTLAIGFKGGEVTPLFFIGATFGNALIWFIPLPLPLLAGIGFLAVFAGATHSPIASSIMGIELFGFEGFEYIFIACSMAYFFSGKKGIYSSQKISYPKQYVYTKINSTFSKSRILNYFSQKN